MLKRIGLLQLYSSTWFLILTSLCNGHLRGGILFPRTVNYKWCLWLHVSWVMVMETDAEQILKYIHKALHLPLMVVDVRLLIFLNCYWFYQSQTDVIKKKDIIVPNWVFLFLGHLIHSGDLLPLFCIMSLKFHVTFWIEISWKYRICLQSYYNVIMAACIQVSSNEGFCPFQGEIISK